MFAGPTSEEVARSEEVMEYIEKTGGVSFVELEKGFPWMFGGDCAICSVFGDNVLHWVNLSDDGAALMTSWEFNYRIQRKPTEHLVYGEASLKYPLANRLVEGGLDTNHWLPLVFWGRDEENADHSFSSVYSTKTKYAMKVFTAWPAPLKVTFLHDLKRARVLPVVTNPNWKHPRYSDLNTEYEQLRMARARSDDAV